jgi:hypothetical protein
MMSDVVREVALDQFGFRAVTVAGHIADISSCAAHVRFRAQSGHALEQMSVFTAAIGGKADTACRGAYSGF